MNLIELRLALTQVLENYQRCGISRLNRTGDVETTQKLLEEFNSTHNAAETNDTTSQSHPAASVITATAEAATMGTAREEVSPSRSTHHPQLEAASVVTHDPSPSAEGWQLPVLTDDERLAEFSALRQQIVACVRCKDIVNFRHQTVFGVGPLQPRICFLGEAPGADEDRTGEPFVGKAGQLLTKIISAMQLKREDVFILNALKCRPPQNRTPVPDEIANCRPFVTAQLEALRPEFIVCLGAVAAQSLLQSTEPIGRMRQRFHHYRGARVVVTYHPSYLLRNENAKRLVWEDMKMLMREL